MQLLQTESGSEICHQGHFTDILHLPSVWRYNNQQMSLQLLWCQVMKDEGLRGRLGCKRSSLIQEE